MSLLDLLQQTHTIAVVGLSPHPWRPSHEIAAYMQQQGYRIIPVNPEVDEVLGEPAYPDLASIPVSVDLVNVFRRSEHCVPIAQQAVAIGARGLWMQLGVVNHEAAEIATRAGLTVVMNRCLLVEHRRLMGA